MGQILSNLRSILFEMGQILSNLISILFGRKKKREKITHEDNRFKVVHCLEEKPIHPASSYTKTRVSERDEGAVFIVISDAEVREDVEPFASTSRDQKSRVSEDERVAIIIDSGAEIVEKNKPTLHVSTCEKNTVSKKDLIVKAPKEKVLQEERRIKHYKSSHKILLVGEGDFSFSACLVKVFGSANNMVSTSLNAEGFLKKNYSNAMSNINDLKSRGCVVLHRVDATTMSRHVFLKGMKFDRIVFNFPHTGFIYKKESREYQISRQQELVTLFFKNAKKMLLEEGEIHISHKSFGPQKEWNTESLASLCGLKFIKAVKFRLNEYPGYYTKYGFGGDGNFDCNPSKTYMFGL